MKCVKLAKSNPLSFDVIVFEFAVNKVTSLFLGCTVDVPDFKYNNHLGTYI